MPNGSASVDVTPAEGQPRGCVGVWTLIPIHSREGVCDWAILDRDDYEWANEHQWSRTHGYAQRKEYLDGDVESIYLHRAIMGLKRGDKRQVDHVNRQRLDNRRRNLRIVTHAQQAQNRSPHGMSSFRGVSHCADSPARPWKAHVMVNGTQHYLGRFATEDEAAATAAAFRAEHVPFATD